MYGTIARVIARPGTEEELRSLSQRLALAPGQIARYAYRMDANPEEYSWWRCLRARRLIGLTRKTRSSMSVLWNCERCCRQTQNGMMGRLWTRGRRKRGEV